MKTTDIRFENHGTVWLAFPQTDRGQQWFDEHVSAEMAYGKAIVIEHRFVGSIIEGAARAGLEVVL